MPAPAFALRLAVGREMADELLLGGQRVMPAKAQRTGFEFRYGTIEAAFNDIYG
jgi:NAD dependent epimerase/dehydratase family enzyme